MIEIENYFFNFQSQPLIWIALDAIPYVLPLIWIHSKRLIKPGFANCFYRIDRKLRETKPTRKKRLHIHVKG